MYVKKLVYYAYIYSYLTYSVAVRGKAAKVHINRVVTKQKQAIKLIYGIKRLDHVAPMPIKIVSYFFFKLYEMPLSCFFSLLYYAS